MKDSIRIQQVNYQEAIAPIQAIRRQVFHLEQGIPPELEFDGKDETATQFLAYWGTLAVGTGRIRYLQSSDETTISTKAKIAKIERIAVLPDYRGRGIGKQLIEVAIAHLSQQGITSIKLNAQCPVQSFYEKLGFIPRGEVFEEAGTAHIEMWYAR